MFPSMSVLMISLAIGWCAPPPRDSWSRMFISIRSCFCSEEPRYRFVAVLWLLDPQERGHHDKDPSVVEGNKVLDANTWRIYDSTFYFLVNFRTERKLTNLCFPQLTLNNDTIIRENSVGLCGQAMAVALATNTALKRKCSMRTLQTFAHINSAL